MKKLFYILLILGLGSAACEKGADDTTPPVNDNPNNENPDDEKPEEELLFNIDIDETQISAYSVVFDVLPKDKEALYYYDIISKARVSTLDVAVIKAEIQSGAESMSAMTGTPVEEVLASFLKKGDTLDEYSYAGYRPETEYCVYAFYWDATTNDEIVVAEFKTLTPGVSAESVAVTFSDLTSYSMTVEVAPTSGITDYWYYFAEKSKADAMLAELEDESAYISYHAMNVGTRHNEAQSFEQKGLKPETEYAVLVMAIDNKLNRLLVDKVQLTPKSETKPRVESELFTALLGEWSGTQTITDLYNAPEKSSFTVTFVESVEGMDYDYRANNQLVALVDGWCRVAYYGVQGLVDEGIENPEDKFGPKWLFNIAEGDVVTLDGKAQHSVVGWMFFGDSYMFNMNPETGVIDKNNDVEVVISEDCNTITIKSPDAMEGYYPGIAYFLQGFDWLGFYYGTSDIILTRK